MRTQEFVSIEVNQVVWSVRNPDFGLPSNLWRVFAEGRSVKERSHEHDSC